MKGAGDGMQARVPNRLLRDHWYIAARSKALGREPLGVVVGDERVVLFRDAEGRARALRDRCPHRGRSLSAGVVRDGAIACSFHGWRFDGDGRCIAQPSLVEGRSPRASCAAARFACEERHGYVWIWHGERAPGPPPDVPFYREGRWVRGTLAIACEAVRAIEISLDGPHLFFVHPSHPHTVARAADGGRLEHRAQEIRETATGFVATMRPRPGDDAALERTMTFDLPGRVTLSTRSPEGEVHTILWAVPTGPTSCRFEYLYLMGPRAPSREERAFVARLARKNFREDAVVLEDVQRAYDEAAEPFERSVPADAAPLAARRVLARAHAGEWPPPRLRREVVEFRM